MQKNRDPNHLNDMTPQGIAARIQERDEYLRLYGGKIQRLYRSEVPIVIAALLRCEIVLPVLAPIEDPL